MTPSRVLKECAPQIAPYLTIIFNQSLSEQQPGFFFFFFFFFSSYGMELLFYIRAMVTAFAD